MQYYEGDAERYPLHEAAFEGRADDLVAGLRGRHAATLGNLGGAPQRPQSTACMLAAAWPSFRGSSLLASGSRGAHAS